MMPGEGIGPEMMGYVKDVFNAASVPVDFETITLDPTTDNYDDLYNVCVKDICTFNFGLFHYLPYRPLVLFGAMDAESKETSKQNSLVLISNLVTLKCAMNLICSSMCSIVNQCRQ